MSFDGPASPAVALRGQSENQPELLPSTWGLAWYPDNQRAAAILKDPDLPAGTPLSGFLEKWGHVRSCLFVGHTHGLRRNNDDGGAQPFVKTYAGRDWLLTGAGDLSAEIKSELALDEDFFDIVPVGATAEEHAFSWLVAQIRSRGCRTIDEFGWQDIHPLLERLNEFGPISILLTDGVDLLAYRDARDEVPLHWSRELPPHETAMLEGRAFLVDYDGPMDVSRTLLTFSTLPMRGARWTPMVPGELRVARRGSSVWSSHPAGIEEHTYRLLGGPKIDQQQDQIQSFGTGTQQQHSFAPALQREIEFQPDRATLSVVHETKFTYSLPVERSSHRFCLQPVRDDRQEMLEHQLEVIVDGIDRKYEDVFGNRSDRCSR